MDRAEKAAQFFLGGYNCAQSVAVAFCDLTGQPPEDASKMASCFGGASLRSAADGYLLRSYGITFLVLIVASTTLGKQVWNRLPEKVQRVAIPVLMLGNLVTATAYLVSGSYNPFLYFRF